MLYEIMSASGHDTVEFKDGKVVSDDKGLMTELKVTTDKELFDKLVGDQKMAPFVLRASSTEPPVRIKSFDQVGPDDDVTMRSQLGGG